MSYPREYRDRFKQLAIANPEMTIPQMLDAIGPCPTNGMPTQSSVSVWVIQARGRTGKRTVRQQLIDEAVGLVVGGMSMYAASLEVARRHGVAPIKCERIRQHLPEDFQYYKPDVTGKREMASDRRWSDEIRALAVRMIAADGMTARQARRHIRKQFNRAPAVETIIRWAGLNVAPKNRVHALNPADPAEELDTYERAWAAAEGLDGAAWAEAVMRTWLPPDDTTASEPDIRVLSTRRRAA